MKETNNEVISIGKIVNTHGHRGEVKVIPLTDDPARFVELKKVTVSLGEKSREYTIEHIKFHKTFVIISFQEIPDMNAAELLKNGFINITKDELRELPAGSYYIFDIIGLRVLDVEGSYLGDIINVFQTGANDVYEVEDKASGKRYLIPALKQVVTNIDLQKKEMIISPLEGLLE